MHLQRKSTLEGLAYACNFFVQIIDGKEIWVGLLYGLCCSGPRANITGNNYGNLNQGLDSWLEVASSKKLRIMWAAMAVACMSPMGLWHVSSCKQL